MLAPKPKNQNFRG